MGVPVVLDRIGVNILATAHYLLGLSRQAAQHLRVGAGKLDLDCMRRADGEVVLAGADVCVGGDVAQLATHLVGHLLHGVEVLAVYDKLGIVVATRRHRPDKAITRGGSAGTDDDAVHVVHAAHRIGQRVDAGVDLVGIVGGGEIALDDKLLVIEVGEEDRADLGHAESGGGKQEQRSGDGDEAVANKPLDNIADGAVDHAVGIAGGVGLA